MFVAADRAVIRQALSAVLLLLSLPAFAPAGRPADSPALLLMAEVRRLQTVSYWPGFDAAAVPAAVYDGSDTYLFDFPPASRKRSAGGGPPP
jgi:hypothetical protein